jgi:asparagine synthase (glutamine-hydrolysing)
MCGIAGVFSVCPDNAGKLSRNVVRMAEVLRHRGPDDQGFWTDCSGRLVLGHCRLAIIDLTPEGCQPMVSGSGRYVISLNGEIYNFMEIRSELEGLGVQFRGRSDTEVFLEAISQWGVTKAIDEAIGMFAFSLWDNIDNVLILARDRAGKKPLYYLRTRDCFCFASELKALRLLNRTSFSLDADSVYQYLTFGYVPSPRTIYKEISEVPAGHYMIIDRKLNVAIRRYWNISWGEKREITFREAIDETDQLLNEAVRIRLRADVPVGCFLSGGIDSGLLTAIASRQMDKPLHTFTVSFADGSFDESSLAGLVAEKYGTDHNMIKLTPRLETILPKVVRAYDQPFADSSALPSYCIAEAARKHLKVVLNGEGGDELFGGYRRHVAINFFARFRAVFDLIPDVFWQEINKVLPEPRAFRSKYAFIHRFMRGIANDPFMRYVVWSVDGFDELEKARLYRESSDSRCSSTDLLASKYNTIEYIDPLDHFMAMDFFLNMHDDMLVKMDIATMAHGLEARNPFLDQRMIESAISLPRQIRMKGANTKPILRELAKRYLPPEIVNAPKRGFEIPLIKWLQEDLFNMVRDVCLSANGILLVLFNKKYIEDLLFCKQKLDSDRWSRRVWSLFMLAMWEDQRR